MAVRLQIDGTMDRHTGRFKSRQTFPLTGDGLELCLDSNCLALNCVFMVSNASCPSGICALQPTSTDHYSGPGDTARRIPTETNPCKNLTTCMLQSFSVGLFSSVCCMWSHASRSQHQAITHSSAGLDQNEQCETLSLVSYIQYDVSSNV